jgi:hypothetical protein
MEERRSISLLPEVVETLKRLQAPGPRKAQSSGC